MANGYSSWNPISKRAKDPLFSLNGFRRILNKGAFRQFAGNGSFVRTRSLPFQRKKKWFREQCKLTYNINNIGVPRRGFCVMGGEGCFVRKTWSSNVNRRFPGCSLFKWGTQPITMSAGFIWYQYVLISGFTQRQQWSGKVLTTRLKSKARVSGHDDRKISSSKVRLLSVQKSCFHSICMQCLVWNAIIGLTLQPDYRLMGLIRHVSVHLESDLF